MLFPSNAKKAFLDAVASILYILGIFFVKIWNVTCSGFSPLIHSYLSRPFDTRPHASVDGKVLDESLVNVTQLASGNPEMVFEEVLVNGKARVDLPLTPMYVTKEDREEASQLKNMKKADLVKRIEDLVTKLVDESAIEFYKEQLSNVQKKIASTKKEFIIALCEEVEQLVEPSSDENATDD